MANQPITADMTIGTIVKEYPQTADVLLSYGLQCVGCAVNPYETIEQGALGHGMTKDLIAQKVKEINLVISKKPDYELNPAGITLSPEAINTLDAMAISEDKKDFGLKIAASKEEAGLDYFLDLVESPEEGDKVFEWQGRQIFISEESLKLMKPSIIDYISLPSGEGFKIYPLNKKNV